MVYTFFNTVSNSNFLKTTFLLQPQVAYGCMNFQPESYSAVAYSIDFLPLVAQQLLINL